MNDSGLTFGINFDFNTRIRVTTKKKRLIGQIRKRLEEDADDMLRKMLRVFTEALISAEAAPGTWSAGVFDYVDWVAGGAVEVYAPASDAWATASSMPDAY